MFINRVAGWSVLDESGYVRPGIDQILEKYSILFADIRGIDNALPCIYSDCMEPDFLCGSEDEIIESSSKITHIFTRRKKILDSCSNASLMVFGTSWVARVESPEKDCSISFTTTNKVKDDSVGGYVLRHQIVENIDGLKGISKIPLHYWASSRLPLKPDKADYCLREKKDEMYRSMFNIAVENQKCDNFFTEKLVDCLVTKTVPVYYGTSDIPDFFDIRGMILVEDMDDLVRVLPTLSEDKYFEMMPYINDNFERSKRYSSDFCTRLSESFIKMEGEMTC